MERRIDSVLYQRGQRIVDFASKNVDLGEAGADFLRAKGRKEGRCNQANPSARMDRLGCKECLPAAYGIHQWQHQSVVGRQGVN